MEEYYEEEFAPEFKGNCGNCNKEIYTFDNPNYNWLDKAAYVVKDENGNPIITGGYGSTTMDMCVAKFCDYELYKKYKNLLKDKDIIYLCDKCIIKMMVENKICYISENVSYDPIDFVPEVKDTLEFKPMMKFPEVSGKNIFVPIQKNVFAYKFSDGPEKIVENMTKYVSFIYEQFYIKYISSENRIVIVDHFGKELKSIGEGMVLVVHDSDDFEVISEKEFNKRYTFVI